MPVSDAEWRELVLTELKELRKDFTAFQLQVTAELGEKRGRGHVITAIVSAITSVFVYVAGRSFKWPF